MDPGTFGDEWQRVEEEANLMPFFLCVMKQGQYTETEKVEESRGEYEVLRRVTKVLDS